MRLSVMPLLKTRDCLFEVVKRLVDIYIESLQVNPKVRNRIDHADFVTAADRERMVKYNIPVNATPGFVIEKSQPLYLMQQAMTLANPSDPESRHFPDWRAKMTYDQVLASYTTIPARH